MAEPGRSIVVLQDPCRPDLVSQDQIRRRKGWLPPTLARRVGPRTSVVERWLWQCCFRHDEVSTDGVDMAATRGARTDYHDVPVKIEEMTVGRREARRLVVLRPSSAAQMKVEDKVEDEGSM